MNVDIHPRMVQHSPLRLADVGVLLIKDDFDQVIGVWWTDEAGVICSVKAGDPDFDKILRGMGIDKRLDVKVISLGG